MPNDKKDAPADAKRPHATLDLKATDVTPAAAASAAANETSASSAASSSATSSDAKLADSMAAAVKAADAKSADAKVSSAGSKPVDGKTDTAAPAAKPVAKRSGGMFSHLVAGIVGGALALFGAEWAAPQLGIATPTQVLQVRTGELQQRLASVEKSAGASDLAAKLKAAEDRLASLEGKSNAIATSQAQLSGDTKAAIEKLSSNSLNAETQQRLNAVDDRLATIAKAAEAGQGGNVAQVTAVTGKVADLQTSMSKEIDALRKTVPQNVVPQMAELQEQAEGAKSGMQRIDNDITNLKTDSARLGQRIETIKADGDRAGATVKVLQEETARLTSGFADLKATVASQVKGGVGEAISPVAKKLATLEEGLQGVVKGEEDRRANAERIVVSLELANLKRLVDSGQNYAAGLAEVRKAAGGKLDLDALEQFKDSGVPTIQELQRDFRPVSNAVVDAAEAPSEGGVIDKLMAGAKSIVRVRNLNPAASDKSAEAVVARMQTALAEGQLGEVLAYAADIPSAASGPVQDWLANVKARHAVDRAMGQVEQQLKTSLTAATVVPPPAPAEPAMSTSTPLVESPASPSRDSTPRTGRLPAPGSVRPSLSTPPPTVPSEDTQR